MALDKIFLDTNKNAPFNPVKVTIREGDANEILPVQLSKNFMEYNLTSATINFEANKPDGKVVLDKQSANFTGKTATGLFYYKLPPELFQASGAITTAYFTIGNRESTSNFQIAVLRKAGSALASDNYITDAEKIVENLRSQVTGADELLTAGRTKINQISNEWAIQKNRINSEWVIQKSGIDTALKNANTAVSKANTAVSSANTAVTKANTATANATTATSKANTATNSANTAASGATSAQLSALAASSKANTSAENANKAKADVEAFMKSAPTNPLFKGEKGDKGDTGDTGDQGIQGIQGPKGDTGSGFEIAGVVETVDSLPTSDVENGAIYAVGTDEFYVFTSGKWAPVNLSSRHKDVTWQNYILESDTLGTFNSDTGSQKTSDYEILPGNKSIHVTGALQGKLSRSVNYVAGKTYIISFYVYTKKDIDGWINIFIKGYETTDEKDYTAGKIYYPKAGLSRISFAFKSKVTKSMTARVEAQKAQDFYIGAFQIEEAKVGQTEPSAYTVNHSTPDWTNSREEMQLYLDTHKIAYTGTETKEELLKLAGIDPNFTGPKGATGEQGPQGLPGKDGIDGARGPQGLPGVSDVSYTYDNIWAGVTNDSGSVKLMSSMGIKIGKIRIVRMYIIISGGISEGGNSIQFTCPIKNNDFINSSSKTTPSVITSRYVGDTIYDGISGFLNGGNLMVSRVGLTKDGIGASYAILIYEAKS